MGSSELKKEDIEKIDGYVFLDLNHPLCAWATCRGILTSAPERAGFLSVWAAGILTNDNTRKLIFEEQLDIVRSNEFPQRISRMQGMFYFPDWKDVEAACSWGVGSRNHFRLENVSSINLFLADRRRDRLDSNWITHAKIDCEGQLVDLDSARRYWSGDAYPDENPTWETLILGKIGVLSPEIRRRAYEKVKIEFPESLCFLEVSRLGAYLGFSVGETHAFLSHSEDMVELQYFMNMEEAENPDFLAGIVDLRKSGDWINYADLRNQLDKGSFGAVPDLRPYGLSCSADSLTWPKRNF